MNAAMSSTQPTIPTQMSVTSTPNEECPSNTTSHPKTTHLLDKVCLVIDLEGFCLGDQFLPRELGWCDWTGQHRGSIHYKPSVPWHDLSPKDQRTAYDCTTHIHGLAYYPQNLYHLAHELKTDAQHLYQQHKTSERSLVAYKGSLIQRRWLTSWGMPHVDLEPLGCPKFKDLPRLSSVGSCGQHEHPLQLHCPQVECYHFVQWMRGQRGLDHDTRYIHHERTQRFLAAQKPRTCLRSMSTQPHYRHFRFCPDRM